MSLMLLTITPNSAGLPPTRLYGRSKEGGRDQAKVALITGVLAEGVAKTRLDAFIAALKDHPEVKIVATEDADRDTAKSE